MVGPDDRCPYERPFAEDFDCCPAYQPVRFVPFDLTHKPLDAVWTCGHLASAPGPVAGFYAQCRLGAAEDRVAWARGVALADRQA